MYPLFFIFLIVLANPTFLNPDQFFESLPDLKEKEQQEQEEPETIILAPKVCGILNIPPTNMQYGEYYCHSA